MSTRYPERNMFATTIWLLLITQCFAKDLGPHAYQHNKNIGSGAPIDYYESIHLPNPHYKINYFYEQRRTDDDPEIEEIEEEIGKYMHYQPSTTTTTTEAIQVPEVKQEDINENFKDATKHVAFETPIIVPETHQENDKEATSNLSPVPPAPELRAPIRPHLSRTTTLSPPVSQWEKLKEVPNIEVAGSHLGRPNFQSYGPHPHHRHPNHRLHISPTTTTSEAPFEVEAQTNHAFTEKHIYLSPTTHVPSFKRHNAQNTLAKVKPILDNIKHDSIRHSPRPVYRGSYKFSLDDINDMHTSTVPKVSQLKENPIPSVPTLSPWYDGYGK